MFMQQDIFIGYISSGFHKQVIPDNYRSKNLPQMFYNSNSRIGFPCLYLTFDHVIFLPLFLQIRIYIFLSVLLALYQEQSSTRE